MADARRFDLSPVAADSQSSIAVATGVDHTCAVTSSGGVMCWGLGAQGELGDGTTTFMRTEPVQAVGLFSGATAVTANEWGTCALASGGAKCWGLNATGQVGDGTTTERLAPVDVSGLTSGVASISMGGVHTCALTSGGGVKCWGNNYYGQLGDGTNTNHLTPVVASGMNSGVRAVSAGSDHTCALMTSGGVKCWGSNLRGQLGDGTYTNRSTPVDVNGLTSGVVAITAGQWNTCAVTSSGGVRCWGFNGYGQLGDGTTTDRGTPVSVSGLTSGVSAVSGKGDHTCALMTSGGVRCWGFNGYGQLGDGTTIDRLTPVDVAGLASGATKIAVGGRGHTCALMNSGGIKCWGDNGYGQLGDGTTIDRHTPVDVVWPPVASPLPIVFVTGWNGMCPAFPCRKSNPQESWAVEVNDLKSPQMGHNGKVFYAILDSSWCYTPSLDSNAAVLQNAIDQAKIATGQSKVILIAHSMGGIVSRAYIEGSTYRNDVDSVFTLGSPHLGIPSQAFLLFSFYGSLDLGTYFLRQPVAVQLSAPGMWVFNQFHSKRSGVSYHFIGGDAPDTSRNALGLLAEWINPGHNDVGIPTNSARADGLSGTIDRMTTDEVHASMVGLRDYFLYDGGLSNSYQHCIRPSLLSPGSYACGTISPQQPSIRTPTIDLPSSFSPVYTGTILNGQTVNVAIPIEGGPALFATSWQTGTVGASLVSPNGQVIDPAFAGANPSVVTYAATGALASYTFPDAIPGAWRVILQGTSVPTNGTSIAAVASVKSGVTLTAQTDQLWYAPGATAGIDATLSGTQAGATVLATVSRSDGITQSITLLAVGTGQYHGTYLIPNVPGYATVYLTAQGTTLAGTTYQKATTAVFQIASNRSSLSGAYSDTPQPRSPGSSLYKSLLLNIGINSSASGAVGIAADLVDLAGNFVAHSNTLSNAPAGPSNLTLGFDGADISASQRNGPYRLTNVLLTDERSVTLVMANATNVYTTAAYKYQSFAPPVTYLPFVSR